MNAQTNSSERSGEAVVDIEGVTKLFGSGSTMVKAVDGIDLRLHRGEVLLVMGPSGSGKTTLLTIIGGILKPTSGVVRINGYEITSMQESQLSKVRRHQVGFVFQTFNLLEALNSVENVEIALNFAGITGKTARNRATALLVDLGMKGRLRFKPQALSGGEKQRVSIARALANNPQLILADEPTANLDSKHGQEVVVLLRDIAKELGRTVVIVSHDPRIIDMADRVLWLEDGRFRDYQQPRRFSADSVPGTFAHVLRQLASQQWPWVERQ